MRITWGTVIAVMEERPGMQRLEVACDEGPGACKAVCYPALTGPVAAGDRVLLNATAVDLRLGTGGAHFVTAVEHVGRPRVGDMVDDPSGGHVMKLRYTPVQRDVLAVEEPASPHHAVMAEAVSIDGMPVVCCGLHSQVPLAAAAAKFARPDARIAYVMTDQASLPIALSEIVSKSLVTGLLDTTFTCGQAYGGQFEAVTLHSALLAARNVAHADLAIVAVGPGVVGTATPYGHAGIAQGEAINAVSVIGGDPVACLRLSFRDARERHTGVSHHSLTALGAIALAPATVAIPVLPALEAAAVEEALESAGVWDLHERAYVEFDLAEAIASVGFEVRTMGRGPLDDPAFFAAAAAAGYVASLSGYHPESTD
jgi:hypothetical protein